MVLPQREKVLFRLFGVPVKASFSWLFLVALLWCNLALAHFPNVLGAQEPAYVYWGLGFVATMGLFASLIVHELCHCLVARYTGVSVAGITLFIFGGVSQLEGEPPTAPAEFFMAIAGPASSIALGCFFLAFWLVASALGWSPLVWSVAQLLFFMNFALAAFNSLPAFPLDGGRVLRSLLWSVSNDLAIATRIAAHVGTFFATGLMMLGLFSLFKHALVQGLWFLVLGYFLRRAALGSLLMLIERQR